LKEEEGLKTQNNPTLKSEVFHKRTTSILYLNCV